jgi:hypothetical protein
MFFQVFFATLAKASPKTLSIQNQFNEAETRYNMIDPLVKEPGGTWLTAVL